MVQIIAGAKGKGKTKYLLDMANTAVKEAKGSVVYLSDSSEKGELDGLFLRIGNFALWQKTLITTVMNTISTCASESGGNRISEA